MLLHQIAQPCEATYEMRLCGRELDTEQCGDLGDPGVGEGIGTLRGQHVKGGARDVAGIQWSEYGGKEGIWRLVKILDNRGVKASVFCNALAADLYGLEVLATDIEVLRSGFDAQIHFARASAAETQSTGPYGRAG